MDIGAVDGEICVGGRKRVVRSWCASSGPPRSTERIYCWDPVRRRRNDELDHLGPQNAPRSNPALDQKKRQATSAVRAGPGKGDPVQH